MEEQLRAKLAQFPRGMQLLWQLWQPARISAPASEAGHEAHYECMQSVAEENAVTPGKATAPVVALIYFPYCLAALPIAGPALARSCGFMIGRKETLALNARNQGSATAGICDVSFMSNTMDPDRWPLSSAKK
jgi:hypothetical protein